MAKRKKIEEELLNNEVENDIDFEDIEDLDEDLITEIEEDEKNEDESLNNSKNEEEEEENENKEDTDEMEDGESEDLDIEETDDLLDDDNEDDIKENIEDEEDNKEIGSIEDEEELEEKGKSEDTKEELLDDDFDEISDFNEDDIEEPDEFEDNEEENDIDNDDMEEDIEENNDEVEEEITEAETVEKVVEDEEEINNDVIDTDEEDLVEETGGVDSANNEENYDNDEIEEEGEGEEEIDEEEEFIDEEEGESNENSNNSTRSLSDALEEQKQMPGQDIKEQEEGKQKKKLDIKEIFNKYKTLIVGVVILVLGGGAIFYGYNNIYKPMFNNQTTTGNVVKKVNVEKVEVEGDATKKITNTSTKTQKTNKTDKMKKEFEIVYKNVKKQINSVGLKIDKQKMKLGKMMGVPYVRIGVRVPTLNEINLDLLQEFCKNYVKGQNTEVLCNKTVLKNGINKYGVAYQKYLETKYNNLINKGLLFFYYKDEWEPLKNFIEDMYGPYLVPYLDDEHIQIWNNFLNIFNQYGKISKIDKAVNDKYLKNIYSYLYSKYSPKDKPELFQKFKELVKIYQFWTK